MAKIRDTLNPAMKLPDPNDFAEDPGPVGY